MLKVMLIDDEPWVLIHLERLVDWETLGFKLCGSFQSCATALEEMQKEPPDILFLDISMPETSGLDFLRKLHSTGLFPHTVVLTGFAEFEYAQDALRLAAKSQTLDAMNQGMCQVLGQFAQQATIRFLTKPRYVRLPGA